MKEGSVRRADLLVAGELLLLEDRHAVRAHLHCSLHSPLQLHGDPCTIRCPSPLRSRLHSQLAARTAS